MKDLKLKTSILIASIYAAVFYGIIFFTNKVYPSIVGPMFDKGQIDAWRSWKVWNPFFLVIIAIVLFGFLVYKTDWKKGLKD